MPKYVIVLSKIFLIAEMHLHCCNGSNTTAILIWKDEDLTGERNQLWFIFVNWVIVIFANAWIKILKRILEF